jgi:hypothetical protein
VHVLQSWEDSTDILSRFKLPVGCKEVSNYQSGAVLSFSESWEMAQPVTFDSMTSKGAELDYPVHEKKV